MTKRLEIWERLLVSTSVRPSLKYSCSGSLLMFTNGSTTMEGLSGNGRDDASFTGTGAEGEEGDTEKCLSTIMPTPTQSRTTALTATRSQGREAGFSGGRDWGGSS